MKRYLKPVVRVSRLKLIKEMASLTDWLSDKGLDQAGITTYLINS